MSREEYLASGILEIYAAGGLTQEEREEVERHAANSPEIRASLEEACSAMEAYAKMYAVSPRPELKNKILSSIQENTAATSFTETEGEASVVPISRGNNVDSSPYRWMFAASIALFIMSGVLSLYFYNKWQQAEGQLATVAASEQLMAQQIQTTSLKSQQLEETLNILRNPAYKPVRLQGVEAHPQARMLVYWNPDQDEVYVDKIELPAPPAGKQYQLWALDKGTPIDAGMIALDNSDALQKMKSIGSAQAFAVTLEPIGGSKNPTLEQLMVMGEVKV